MVDLYTEDDLEGAMKPQFQLCNTKCSRSQRCKRHVMHHPSWQGQAHVLFHPKDAVRCQAYIAWNKDDVRPNA